MPVGLEAYLRHHCSDTDPWFNPPDRVLGAVSYAAARAWVWDLRNFSRSNPMRGPAARR